MNTKNTTFIGSRWFYAICFIGLFIVETLIALFVRDAFIRPYMGDVLVVILIYCFVRIFITEPLRGLPLWIFLFACCIAVPSTYYCTGITRLYIGKSSIGYVILMVGHCLLCSGVCASILYKKVAAIPFEFLF